MPYYIGYNSSAMGPSNTQGTPSYVITHYTIQLVGHGPKQHPSRLRLEPRKYRKYRKYIEAYPISTTRMIGHTIVGT